MLPERYLREQKEEIEIRLGTRWVEAKHKSSGLKQNGKDVENAVSNLWYLLEQNGKLT